MSGKRETPRDDTHTRQQIYKVYHFLKPFSMSRNLWIIIYVFHWLHLLPCKISSNDSRETHHERQIEMVSTSNAVRKCRQSWQKLKIDTRCSPYASHCCAFEIDDQRDEIYFTTPWAPINATTGEKELTVNGAYDINCSVLFDSSVFLFLIFLLNHFPPFPFAVDALFRSIFAAPLGSKMHWSAPYTSKLCEFDSLSSLLPSWGRTWGLVFVTRLIIASSGH